jgi:hypothetical protein
MRLYTCSYKYNYAAIDSLRNIFSPVTRAIFFLGGTE